MPQKKKIPARRSRKAVSRLAVEKDQELFSETLAPEKPQSPRRLLPGIVIVVLLAAGVLLYFNRKLFIAATVNGSPIFRSQLNSVLLSRYGKQTLESMVSEQLIAEEAQKAGVTVTQQEILKKEDEVVKSLGSDVNIDQLLEYQGISREDFDKQIKVQLLVQKILGKDVKITDSDIDGFIATSAARLTATEPATMREEAKQMILDEKVGEQIQTWFSTIKDKAKITRYL
jgi:hypothetical protein